MSLRFALAFGFVWVSVLPACGTTDNQGDGFDVTIQTFDTTKPKDTGSKDADTAVEDSQVDASSGKLYYLGSRYDDPSAQPITARAGFNTALARAREWNPGATLLSARVEFPSGDKTWPVGGVARFWHYQFIVLPEPNGKDYQPAFDVVAGSSGLASFRAGETYTYAAVGNQADWSIDSDEAYRISEENGGKAFRDQHGSLVYGMMLNLGFNQAEPLNTSKNVRWSASYSMESDPYTKLDLQIDAASGKTVSKQ